jgi:hypothetical protein
MEYTVVLSLIGGMLLSQGINMSYKLYYTLLDNDRKRTELVVQEIAKEREKTNAMIEQAERRMETQSRLLEARINDQKDMMTQMIASLSAKVATEKGTYASYFGMTENNAKYMEKHVDKCSDALQTHLKKLMNDVEKRDEKFETEKNADPSALGDMTAPVLRSFVQNSEKMNKEDADSIGLVMKSSLRPIPIEFPEI